MRELSGKIAGIAPSATMAISNEAKKMQARGIDVISLSIGEPDFDTPVISKKHALMHFGGVKPTMHRVTASPN